MICVTMYCAISRPAVAGTQTSDPGTLLRPGGGASTCSGSIGSSGEKTTG